MKFLYPILVVLTTTMIAPLPMFSSTYDELVYAQQQKENQTNFIDIQQEEQMNLNLGKPIYTEIFTAPKSHDKLTSSVYSFSGNGIINGMEISSSGNGLIIPREDGTSAVTDGRALFTSKSGNASYSFEAIININENVTRHLGAAFFDANATGNLEFLQSVVGVYKAVLDEKGTFTMWQLK